MLAGAAVGKDGHEEALTGDEALARTHQRTHDTRTLLLAAVAENSLHLNTGGHEHHRAGFGHGALTRIELDLHELHLATQDSKIYLVRCCHQALLAPGPLRGTRPTSLVSGLWSLVLSL